MIQVMRLLTQVLSEVEIEDQIQVKKRRSRKLKIQGPSETEVQLELDRGEIWMKNCRLKAQQELDRGEMRDCRLGTNYDQNCVINSA